MEYATPEEEWYAFLSGTHPHLQHGSPLRFVPSSPRCKICRAPFGRPGSFILRRYGYTPWEKNPKICGRCLKGLTDQAGQCPGWSEDEQIGGAEVELSMLFADVRGSSKLARQMPAMDFTRLMNRFYRVATEVLFAADAIVEKFVGDAVVGLFLPFMTGQEHARRALEAAETLMRETGHGSAEDEWIALGAGVHTGTAFVGIVSSAEGTSDFTALGDPVNVTAHLAAQAADGEILVTTQAAEAASLADHELERRNLSLKGYPVEALVLRPHAEAAGGAAPAS